MTTEQVMANMKSFSLKDKTPDKVRDIISAVIDSVIVKQDEIEVILRLSFDWWRRGDTVQAENFCYQKYNAMRTSGIGRTPPQIILNNIGANVYL